MNAVFVFKLTKGWNDGWCSLEAASSLLLNVESEELSGGNIEGLSHWSYERVWQALLSMLHLCTNALLFSATFFKMTTISTIHVTSIFLVLC